MKYLITFLISTLCLESFAAGTAWQNYPTTNSMGSSDTLMIGNGSTNLTITAGNFNSTQTQPLVNTASNNIMGYVGSTTNFVLLSGSNGPPVVGNALVITGTNASGATVVKSTNFPSGGGTGTLLPPNAVGVLTNDGSGNTNWSTALPYAWVSGGVQPAINTSSNSVVTNLPYAGKYIALTNSVTGIARQVPISTAHLDTNSSPAATWTNLLMTDMEFHVLTNAFTNNIVGYIKLTNYDGLVFSILVGTNLP